MSRVFHHRSIRWQEPDGSWSEQSGYPAIVRTSGKCQTRDQRKAMLHQAKLARVKLVPIQWGETMAHGHQAVVAWLALGEDADVMERQFLDSGLVTWEHCVSYEIPHGATKLKRKAEKVRPVPCTWVDLNNERRELESRTRTQAEEQELRNIRRKLSHNDADQA